MLSCVPSLTANVRRFLHCAGGIAGNAGEEEGGWGDIVMHDLEENITVTFKLLSLPPNATGVLPDGTVSFPLGHNTATAGGVGGGASTNSILRLVCGAWNGTAWDTDGCFVVGANSTSLSCACKHRRLTNCRTCAIACDN